MISDAQLSFVPINGNQSMVAGAGISIPSANTIDLLGQGVGSAPVNITGIAALFGEDVGVGGRNRPELNVITGTAFATATGATLNVALQSATDTGAAGNFLPGVWQTIEETGPLTAAQLAANTIIMRLPFPPSFPANQRPRFLRLLFQIPAGANFTAGTISSATITIVRDDLNQRNVPRNFVVA